MKRIGTKSIAISLLLACVAVPARGEITCRATIHGTVAQRWQQHMTLEAADGFSGSLLIAEGEWVRYTGEWGPPAQDKIATPFWIGSISKVVTAVAVLKLVEQGKLALDAPISTYLGQVPERWQGVTVHQLLSERSGLPDARAADGIADRGKALKAILALQPMKKPGELESSNDGYTLLAVLIEVASGQSFESYVQTQIFDPSSMKHAGFWGFEPSPSPVAAPASPEQSKKMSHRIWRDGHSVANWGYRGGTGMFAVREDLYYLWMMLRTNKVLKESTFASMISPKSEGLASDAQGHGYGLNFKLSGGKVYEFWQMGEEDWLGHSALIKVSGERLTVVLSNSGRSGDSTWTHRIEEGLLACANQ
ncbi:MAG TPA: serine hydrolase domain-containing protein [Candidatus Polarisedimenticolia bacterium]|nr:serine hydrolase domain-containing protein [Candidatus Polarisedimenticolia bacterium]